MLEQSEGLGNQAYQANEVKETKIKFFFQRPLNREIHACA